MAVMQNLPIFNAATWDDKTKHPQQVAFGESVPEAESDVLVHRCFTKIWKASSVFFPCRCLGFKNM